MDHHWQFALPLDDRSQLPLRLRVWWLKHLLKALIVGGLRFGIVLQVGGGLAALQV